MISLELLLCVLYFINFQLPMCLISPRLDIVLIRCSNFVLIIFPNCNEKNSIKIFPKNKTPVKTWVEGVPKLFALAKNLAINKKSTIVVQSLWNLVKIFISWVLYVPKISAWLDQNCGFFINSQVFGQCK